MSGYMAGLSCIALVLSPLFIPMAVTVVHWVRKWRLTPHAVKPAVGTQRRSQVSGVAAGVEVSAGAGRGAQRA
jgi:hypothetical protein